jgi:hypothetical protein
VAKHLWQNILFPFKLILPGGAIATGNGNKQLAGGKTSYFNTAFIARYIFGG